MSRPVELTLISQAERRDFHFTYQINVLQSIDQWTLHFQIPANILYIIIIIIESILKNIKI